MNNQNKLIERIVDKFKIYEQNQIVEILNNPENPIILTFESIENNPISIPIWILSYEGKFYAFSSKNSQKVKTIEHGNCDVILLIINSKYYPHPEDGKIPYLGIKATARITYYKDNDRIAKIHQHLLKKYDPNLSFDWIKNLYIKIGDSPESTWLIEIIPNSFYSY